MGCLTPAITYRTVGFAGGSVKDGPRAHRGEDQTVPDTPETPDTPTARRHPDLERVRSRVTAYVYGNVLVLAAVVVWAFLGPVERYERRVALDQQEAFSGYRTASQEQGR